MTQLININFLAMTSKEIAELCDKNINHVNRDIKVMLEQLDDHYPNLDSMYKTVTYKQKVGFGERDNVMYYLNKELTLTLVAGYNVKLRNAIVKRWQELENQQALQLPNFANPAEAAIAWAHQYTLAQEAIKTKAEIGSRREATSMATASVATKKANKLELELDKSKEFATIKRVESITGCRYNWRELRKSSTLNNYPINDVFDSNYGSVKSYHADAWLDVYGVDITEFK